MRKLVLAVTLVCLVACQDSDDPIDAAIADVALGADADEILPDAGPSVTCGTDEPPLECDPLTELCVLTDLGGIPLASCEPRPVGCGSDSCCQVCQAPADECSWSPEDPDRVLCTCLEC